MSTQTVGIREFRDKLATYLLESDKPLAITRHGDTIGYYLPIRRKRTEAEKKILDEVHAKMQKMMAEASITEDEILDEFKRLRAEERRRRGQS